jgi:hypothetical protein
VAPSKKKDVELFRKKTIGVEEPFFGMVNALPGLKWRMAALAGAPCAGAFHQQTFPGVCDARSAMAGLFLRLLRLDDIRPCAREDQNDKVSFCSATAAATGKDASDNLSFASSTAAATGKDRRTIERAAGRRTDDAAHR